MNVNENYFNIIGPDWDTILTVIIGGIIWFFFGRNPRIPITTQHYPPRRTNSAEAGYIYQGRATTKSILSHYLMKMKHRQ